jgi:ADP-heptose:LPS heptosyltransferase
MVNSFSNSFLQVPQKKLSKLVAGLQNRFIGCPARLLYMGCGIGDDLLCTAVAHELKKRGVGRIVMFSKYAELFRLNPDIDAVFNFEAASFGRLQHWGVEATHPYYGSYDGVSDWDGYEEKIILRMCRLAKITGSISLRPYLYLSPKERAVGRKFDAQIAIQSAGLGQMKNKDWFVERYQAVAKALSAHARIIQIGLASDPLIDQALDLRGKTTLRESAAILANSKLFVGQVGFLMHLARAVDCRSVVVYGGREDPAITGYAVNENIVGKTPCSPCWFRNRCDYDRECLKIVTVEMVVVAALRILEHNQASLPVELTDIEVQ